MATADDIRGLGYEVTEVNDGTVLLVDGYGVTTHIAADDEEAIAKFCDPDAHANRVDQFENPPEGMAPPPGT